ncbi:MAG: dienelactone hydrolase family protein [Coxiellaceae bacterium]|jgi:phospholipase/carboxylesterase|nr:dienelactone hydrolase family protein [Coxiellaceae bacterium]
MLQAREINPKLLPHASIIWLHGLGASGDDFINIVHLLDLPPQLSVRFVFPHAPLRQVTYSGNAKIRAWFNVVDLKRDSQIDEIGIRESQGLINELIAQELAQKNPDYKVVLAGFSQGGVMALQCGLRYPERLAGILVLSGWLALEHTVPLEKASINQQTPILMLHGTNDELIPLDWARAGCDYLRKLDYNIRLLSYPMKHTVCAEEIATIGNWLHDLLL